MNIDPKEIDEIKDPHERADFIVLLKNLLDYSLKSFGMSEPPGSPPQPLQIPPKDSPADAKSALQDDPVGEVIIEGFKMQQQKAMIRRRESGWMKTGFSDRIDDRHV